MKAFVAFHLAFLFFRNPVSIYQDEFDRWVERSERSESAPARMGAIALHAIDDGFTRYERLLGIDQGWRMFVAPLARTAAFPAVELEFSDGSKELLLSDNEPRAIDGFVMRPSHPRLRKHETQIASTAPQELGLTDYWERYLAYKCQSWRDAHPNDTREVTRMVLIRRLFELPAPDAAVPSYGVPISDVMGDMSGATCNR